MLPVAAIYQLRGALLRIGQHLDDYGTPVPDHLWDGLCSDIRAAAIALDEHLSSTSREAKATLPSALRSLRGGTPTAITLSAPGRNLLLLGVWPVEARLGRMCNPIVRARWEADVVGETMRSDSVRDVR